jgi:hypothetical protein
MRSAVGNINCSTTVNGYGWPQIVEIDVSTTGFCVLEIKPGYSLILTEDTYKQIPSEYIFIQLKDWGGHKKFSPFKPLN